MIEKRFIFTIATGRSGTGYLANLLGIFKGVTTFHEPEPAYSLCLRKAQNDPAEAKSFLLSTKIPAICRTSVSPIYVETTHLFCEGFLEPWLGISELPVPDMILLTRDFRKSALSRCALKSIPGRTEQGWNYQLSPSAKICFTRLENWEKMNDYQLCYWQCLEVEERKRRYSVLIQQRNGRVLTTSIERLQTPVGILEAQKLLNLPSLSVRGWLSYFKRSNTRVNGKKKSKTISTFSSDELDQWEEEVRQSTSIID